MAREVDEESKSYSAVFLVTIGLLLLGSIWSIWDDNIARRPWKKYQAEFFGMEIDKVRAELDEAEQRLDQDPEVQEARGALAQAREEIASGESARQLEALNAELARVRITESEWDLKLRIVKSEIEEARYSYEHAVELGQSGKAEREYLDGKEAEKTKFDTKYKEAQDRVAGIEARIKEINSRVKGFEDQLRDLSAERDRIANKLDGLTVNLNLGFGTLHFPKVPRIEQTVLEEFDRNAYEQPVARVDRCTSCHAGINKDGFERAEQPFRTHPDRKNILFNHPPEKFACTPCHEGQGPAVNSIAMGHGEVPYWERPLMRGDKVQANCIGCHADVRRLSHTEQIATGEKLFEQLGCHGCHLVEGYDGLAKVGPSLRPVAAKDDPGWMVSWIETPHDFRPRTKMPWFVFSREQSEQTAAYLLAASAKESEQWLAAHPDPQGVNSSDAALVAAGKELVESIGCRGCHSFSPDEVTSPLSKGKDVAPNLSRIGEKTNARWIYNWIKDPESYNPGTRMPNLRLTDSEAAAITSYLLTLRRPAEEDSVAEDEGLAQRLASAEAIAAGEKLVRKYGCFGCHDIPGMEKESRIGVELTLFGSKSLEELFFGEHKEIPRNWDNWTFYKLKDPRIYETEFIEQMMPNFRLRKAEIEALRIFLASRVEHSVPTKYRFPDPEGFEAKLVAGRRLLDDYNCRGCHVIDEVGGDIRAHYKDNPNLAPPNLHGEGKKVQADWLYAFVKSPTPIRPWLQVRMPTFGFSDVEARTIVEYFQAVDQVKNPYVYVNLAKIPQENIEAARTLVSADYFSCFSCHQQGDKKPEGPPEGWAPDLGMAYQRLNPDWIVDWIKDPQALMPGTKMPAYYPGGPDDGFAGDEDRQREALRDYLMLLGRPGSSARLARDTATQEAGSSS